MMLQPLESSPLNGCPLLFLVTIAANGTIQLAAPGSEAIQGLQAVANASGGQQGTTILQYAQTPDGQQILVPSNQVVVQGECLTLTFRVCTVKQMQ